MMYKTESDALKEGATAKTMANIKMCYHVMLELMSVVVFSL